MKFSSEFFKPYRSLLLICVFVCGSITADAGDVNAAKSEISGNNCFSLNSDEYPIGIYAVPATDEAFARVKKAGFAYVHQYGLAGYDTAEQIKTCQNYLDLAHKHGLKVMFDLWGRSWIPMGNDGLKKLRTLVRRFKSHPAIGFFYLDDEPDGRIPLKDMLPFYKMLKEEAPNVPVAIAQCWSDNWYGYAGTYDILMTDIYPVYSQPFPRESIQNSTKFCEEGLKLGKPVFPVLQGFNWADAADTVGPKDSKTVQGKDVSTLRYPDIRELRYWLYATKLQGARGVFFWSYYRSVIKSSTWFDGVLTPAVSEFSKFIDAVKSPKQTINFMRARDANLYIEYWDCDKEKYLVFVNSWPLERVITRRLNGVPDNCVLEPWGLTRKEASPSFEGGVLKVTAQPWEVFVWKLNPAPSPQATKEEH